MLLYNKYIVAREGLFHKGGPIIYNILLIYIYIIYIIIYIYYIYIYIFVCIIITFFGFMTMLCVSNRPSDGIDYCVGGKAWEK